MLDKKIEEIVERFVPSPPCAFCAEKNLTEADGCGCWKMQETARWNIKCLITSELEAFAGELLNYTIHTNDSTSGNDEDIQRIPLQDEIRKALAKHKEEDESTSR